MTVSIEPSSHENISHIKNTAKDIFVKTLMTEGKGFNGALTVIPTNKPVLDLVLEVVGDGGLLHLSTFEDLTDIWSRFRTVEEDSGSSWLIQAATTFRVLAFRDETERMRWIHRLAACYCSHTDGDGRYIAIDEDFADRLPKLDDHNQFLINNPWLVYLTTLQLSYHEIYADLIAKYGGALMPDEKER